MSDKKNTPSILPESKLSTLFVDSLKIDTRADGMHLVRFFTSLPEGWSEQTRLMISDLHLDQMLQVLTSHCEAWKSHNQENVSPVT